MSSPQPQVEAPVGEVQGTWSPAVSVDGASGVVDHSGEVDICWPELVLIGVALLVAVSGTFGLLLALFDQFRTSLTVAVALPVTTLLIVLLWRGATIARLDRSARWGWLIAGVIAAVFVVAVVSASSQHLLLDRDPGSYVSTARWLADHPGLTVEPATGGFENAPASDLDFGGGPVYEMRDGSLQFQFNHMSAVVMAVVFDIAGTSAMLAVPAVVAALGLLAIYGVTTRMLRRPLFALVAPASLAVCMPLLFVSRDAYSEPFVMALLWVGVVIALRNHRSPTFTGGVVTAVLLGSLVAIRIDALVVLAVAFPLMVLSLATADPARRIRLLRSYCVMTATLGVVMLVGFMDLRNRAGRYESDLASQLDMLRLLAIASIIISAGSIVWWFGAPRARSRVRPLGARSALTCALLLVVLVGAAWLLRPLVQVDRLGEVNSTVEGVQVRDGLPLEPDRSYAEFALWWMSWYLGPVALVAAIAGLGIGCYRMLRARADPALVVVWTLCIATGALYWWRPSNTPDQVWVMRRYVPSVLPCVAMLAVFALAGAVHRWGGSGARRAAVTSVAVLAMVAPPLITTWPVRKMSFQTGYIDAMEELCATIGDDAAVLVPASYEQLVLAQPIRSWCDVPVAVQARPFSREDYTRIADLVETQGRSLWIVALDGPALAALDMDAGAVRSTGPAPVEHMPVARLDAPPDGYVDPGDTLPSFVPTPFALHARPVAPTA